MAANDLIYGTRTVLADISRVHSDTNGLATAFGEVDNSTLLALDYSVHILLPISTLAVAGSYDLYLVESQEGTEWTDGIDPATDSAYVDFLKDAKLIRSAETIYDNAPAGARTNVRFHFNILDLVAMCPKFFGFVLHNRSGQTVPASGADGDSMSIKIAA